MKDSEENAIDPIEELKQLAAAMLSGEVGLLEGAMQLYGISRDIAIDRAPYFDYLWDVCDEAGNCRLYPGDRFGRSQNLIDKMDYRAKELETAYRDDLLKTCQYILTLDDDNLAELVEFSSKLEALQKMPIVRYSGIEETLATMPNVCDERQNLTTIFQWWNRGFTWIEEFDPKLSQDLSEAVSGLSDWITKWQIEKYRERGLEHELIPDFELLAGKYLKTRLDLLEKLKSKL